MKISEMIAQLSRILVEHGDVEVVGTEYAGIARRPVETVTFQDEDDYGRPVTQAKIIVRDRYG